MQAFGGLCLRSAFLATTLAFGLLMASTAALTASTLTASTGFAPLYHLYQILKFLQEQEQEQLQILTKLHLKGHLGLFYLGEFVLKYLKVFL